MLQELLALWSPQGIERCGVIANGEVVELENIHPSPAESFAMDIEGIENITATWHTHPRSSANLSKTDHTSFKCYPEFLHYIVSNQNVWCFKIQNNEVIFDHDDSHITRLSS